jgi:NAD(P)H-nitrite reductase large subunit
MAPNSVTECICHNRDFSEIKEYAHQNNVDSLDELQDQNYCSNSCGLCGPYVEILLQTGQTVFKPGEPFGKKR